MSKFGDDDTAPDVHGDDSYRAATNVVIQGKYLLLLYNKRHFNIEKF